MLIKPQTTRIGSVSLMLGCLFGCANFTQSRLSLLPGPNVPVTQIRELQARPQSSTLYLKGQVGKQVPFLDSRAYELKDATGTIWVVTKQTMPKQQDTVLLKVKVQQKNIRVGGKTLKEVYVEEQQRL